MWAVVDKRSLTSKWTDSEINEVLKKSIESPMDSIDSKQAAPSVTFQNPYRGVVPQHWIGLSISGHRTHPCGGVKTRVSTNG